MPGCEGVLMLKVARRAALLPSPIPRLFGPPRFGTVSSRQEERRLPVAWEASICPSSIHSASAYAGLKMPDASKV
jgi:hypothetical protein